MFALLAWRNKVYNYIAWCILRILEVVNVCGISQCENLKLILLYQFYHSDSFSFFIFTPSPRIFLLLAPFLYSFPCLSPKSSYDPANTTTITTIIITNNFRDCSSGLAFHQGVFKHLIASGEMTLSAQGGGRVRSGHSTHPVSYY